MRRLCRWLVLLFFLSGCAARVNSCGAAAPNADGTDEFTIAIRTNTPLTALIFSPDHQFLLGSSAAGLKYWRWPSMEEAGELATEIELIQDLKFSPTGRHLSVVGGIPSENGLIEIWDWTGKRREQQYAAHDDLIMQADWSDDEQRLATASFDGTCGLWDWATAQSVANYRGHSKPVLTVRFWGPDQLLSAGVDHSIRYWHGPAYAEQRVFDNHLGTVSNILVEPTEKSLRTRRLVSISEDRTVRLWQPEIGRLIRFQRLPSVPSTATWAPGNESILVGCEDGMLYRLQQDSLEIIDQHHPGIGALHAVIVHPRTGQVVVAGRGGIAVKSNE